VQPLHSIRVVRGIPMMMALVLASSTAPAADLQVLVSSCSGCHTNSQKLSTAIPRIQGLPEAIILDTLRGFRSGQRPATVMDRITKGFTEDEIKELAAYFSAEK
jgi:sulfide dehydrogenase cytochrome subunit